MPKRPVKSLQERRLDAETRANQWLADGNAANEAGDQVKAAACYDKSQFWLDRLNLLENRAAKAAPKR